VQLHGPFRSYCVGLELHLTGKQVCWFNANREALLGDMLEVLSKNCDVLLNKENISSSIAEGVDGTSATTTSRKRKREQKLFGKLLQLHWEARGTRPVGHVLLYKGGKSTSGGRGSGGGNGSGGSGGGGDSGGDSGGGSGSDNDSGGGDGDGGGDDGDDDDGDGDGGVRRAQGFTHLVTLPVTILAWPAPRESECDTDDRYITSFFSAATGSAE
jgi:hypothetical protein